MKTIPQHWFPAILIGLGILILVFGIKNRMLALVSADWPQVHGNITDVQIVKKTSRRRMRSARQTSYQTEISFAYSVGQKEHESKQLMFEDSRSAAQIAKQYPVGSTAIVMYNPDTPSDSFLEPPSPSTTFGLFVFGIIFLTSGIVCLCFERLKKPNTDANHVQPTLRPVSNSERANERPSTIGDISAVIGRDVRELIIEGWTQQEVQNLVTKKLAERNLRQIIGN